MLLCRRMTPWLMPGAPVAWGSRRRFASTAEPGGASHTSAGKEAGYGHTTDEEEQDRILEEEEFAALNERDGDEYLPLIHRLAKKADALDTELTRLRWNLFARRQLLMDTAAATLTGRPTRADRAIAAAHRATPPGTAMEAAGHANAAATRGPPGQVARVDYEPFLNWHGASSVPVQLFKKLSLVRGSTAPSAPSASGTELATLTADLDYLRRARALHALNYYSRINLNPKRHMGHAVYQVLWNAWIGVQNGTGALLFTLLREVRERGAAAGVVVGLGKGASKAAQFLLFGLVVSPCIHIPRGLCNSLYGPVNFLRGTYMFDAMSGRWMRCTVADAVLLRHALQREKRAIHTIGRAEFRRKRLATETKWSERLASMGFSVESVQHKLRAATTRGGASPRAAKPEESVRDPYQTLGVRRTATQQQVKQQYKKLAMAYHPDVVGSRGPQSEEQVRETHRRFEAISTAYQILSNPEKRKAYDLGGSKGLEMHEGKYGHFMSRTPAQMVQSIFGGEGFRRRLIGDVLRSHWSLRFEAQVSVSLHELEELQCIRVRQMAVELAAMADVHAKRPAAGPYYKHADVGVGGGRRKLVHSSSLPDPLGSRSSSSSAAAAARLGRPRATPSRDRSGSGGAAAPISRDLQEDILAELGEAPAGAHRAKGHRPISSSSSSSGGSGESGGATATGPTGSRSPSPFVLVPGSNEYNSFTKDFETRCERFVARMSEACFGPELLHEVGQAYVVGAQRFLGIKPFYAPKQLTTKKVFSGFDRVLTAFRETKKLEKEEAARKVMSEYFSMEFDNVVCDLHFALRYAVQLVLQDCVETEEVRRKRCYAVWYLGERMMARGTPWGDGVRDDAEVIAYVQQAATSSASTAKPPTF